jgi:hypothetical protein
MGRQEREVGESTHLDRPQLLVERGRGRKEEARVVDAKLLRAPKDFSEA